MGLDAGCLQVKVKKPSLVEEPKVVKDSQLQVVANKLETLSHKEVQRLFSKGRKVNLSPWVFAFFLKEKEFRVGLTLSRKLGKACVRNRIKRWVKEFLRKEKLKTPLHVNFIFSSHKKGFFKDLKYKEFENEFSKSIKKVKNLCI